jgi:hypothetical protein
LDLCLHLCSSQGPFWPPITRGPCSVRFYHSNIPIFWTECSTVWNSFTSCFSCLWSVFFMRCQFYEAGSLSVLLSVVLFPVPSWLVTQPGFNSYLLIGGEG